MPEDRGHTDPKREELQRADPRTEMGHFGGEEEHRKRALECIEEEDDDRRRGAEGAIDIGRPEVPRADRAQVDPLKQSTGEIGEGDRPREIPMASAPMGGISVRRSSASG